MGAGQVNLDLTGDWKKNLSVNIQGGVGNAHIRLPKNVGVEASVSGGIGSVDSGGLKKHDGEYVNDAYGQSPVTVRVTVQGGVGSVDLESEK
jgi:predicted membrane protein